MRTFVIALALLVLSPAVAVAQTDAEKAEAAFAAAKAAYEKGDHRLSISKLREAYRYYPDPAIMISVARRLLDLDEPEEAMAELNKIVSKNRRLMRAVKAEKEKVAGLLAQPVPVLISTTPAGAMVKVGDDKPAKSPIRKSLPRGKVQLSILLGGYKPFAMELKVKGTKTLRVPIKLKKLISRLRVELRGVDPEREEGTPTLELNGKPVKSGQVQNVEPGRFIAKCGYPKGAPPTVVRFSVPAGKNASIICALPGPLETPRTWKTPVGWSTVSGGAAAVAAGIGIFVSHAVDQGAYEEPRFTVNSTSKPLAGGLVTGLGAGLIGLGTYFLLSD